MRFSGWAGPEDSPESGNPTLLSASKSTPTLEGGAEKLLMEVFPLSFRRAPER